MRYQASTLPFDVARFEKAKHDLATNVVGLLVELSLPLLPSMCVLEYFYASGMWYFSQGTY